MDRCHRSHINIRTFIFLSSLKQILIGISLLHPILHQVLLSPLKLLQNGLIVRHTLVRQLQIDQCIFIVFQRNVRLSTPKQSLHILRVDQQRFVAGQNHFQMVAHFQFNRRSIYVVDNLNLLQLIDVRIEVDTIVEEFQIATNFSILSFGQNVVLLVEVVVAGIFDGFEHFEHFLNLQVVCFINVFVNLKYIQPTVRSSVSCSSQSQANGGNLSAVSSASQMPQSLGSREFNSPLFTIMKFCEFNQIFENFQIDIFLYLQWKSSVGHILL
jgi:hypothetical protein